MDEDLVSTLSDEFRDQFAKLELCTLELLQENSVSIDKFKILEEKHQNYLKEQRLKEGQDIIDKSTQNEKVLQVEHEKLQLKVEYEQKSKNFQQEMNKCMAQCQIYQKEAQLAKDQLRLKINALIRLEDTLKELQEKGKY